MVNCRFNTGEMLRNSYIRKLHPKNLSRSLEDGAVIEPLVPWTAAGVYMATLVYLH